MTDLPAMQIGQNWEQLLDYALRFLLTKLTLGLTFQMRMQAFPQSILHDQKDVLGCVNSLEKFDDIGMI